MTNTQREALTLQKLSELGFNSQDVTCILQHGWTVPQIRAEIDRLLSSGLTSERYVRETFQEANPELFTAVHRFTTKTASAFGDVETRFVWYPYIPAGDFTVLMAPGGTGKTYFVCGLAAAISTGRPLPGEDAREPANVLLISAEDPGEIFKKRLRASGADLDRVFILDSRDSIGLNFTSGIETFKSVIAEHKPELVVVDPWHGYIGEDVDINRVNQVRPVFQRLANIAKDCDCGLILVSHVNKRAQGENINFAATGSSDFINASRSALVCIFDEDDPDGRIVVHSKTNYAAYGQSVKFRIEWNAGLIWNGFSDIDRSTLELAARQRKTPGEVLHAKEDHDSMNTRLVSELLRVADPSKTIRFSYEEFKIECGSGIFGSAQPKRALDSVADAMYSRGYEIRAGINVRGESGIGKGFSISPLVNSF